MLEIQLIRENSELVVQRLSIKNFNTRATIAQILDIDKARRDFKNRKGQVLAETNILSKETSDQPK
ncbi:MAG: hypothetical protein U1C46_09270 [Bacteroidales bacterium]|nr:hypothetical protein [Bacteroidales bacterium]MDZ4204993.1 hypothetical protein [Bacteroidales bacterium]